MPEYNLEDLHKTYGIETEDILRLVEEMIVEKELTGVIKSQSVYVSSQQFEETISDFIEDNIEDSLEMTFKHISDKLDVSEKDIERFLVKYVDNNPQKLVVYPLEKKILFKG